jgi:hypothetical protein
MPVLTVNDIHNATTTFLSRRDDLKTRLTPTHTQKVTLIVAASYVGAIAILWYDL